MIGQSVELIVFVGFFPIDREITGTDTRSCSCRGGGTPQICSGCGGWHFPPLGQSFCPVIDYENAIVCSKLFAKVLDLIKYWRVRADLAVDVPCSGMINHDFAGVLF